MKRRKGFTLIEVLVALAVVSGVFMLILSSFSLHLDIYGKKKERFRLFQTARENLYLYNAGRLSDLTGTKEGIAYELSSEEASYGLWKVTSRARAGNETTELSLYVRK